MKYCEKPSLCEAVQTEIRMCVNSVSPNATFQLALKVKPFDIDESGNGKAFLFPACIGTKKTSGKLTHLSRCWGPAQLVAVIIVLRRPRLMGVATNSSLIASTKLITGQQWSKNQRKYIEAGTNVILRKGEKKYSVYNTESAIHISLTMFHRLLNLVAVSHDIVMS